MPTTAKRFELGLLLLVVLSISYIGLDFLDKKMFHWRRAMTFSNPVVVDLVDALIKLLPGIIVTVTIGMNMLNM